MRQLSALSSHIHTAVKAALAEDLSTRDVTTRTLFPDALPSRGQIVAREDLTLAGIEVACQVFTEIDSSLKIIAKRRNGEPLQAGHVFLTVEGDARSLLMAERVALNFLQHLSGIATLTARFCQAIRGYPTKILDTRKTLPGLRMLEKLAVAIGGGLNHRYSLGDGLLIKDNHLALLHTQGTNLTQACRLAKERRPHNLRVCVEVESLPQVQEAIDGQADVILLDNMTPDSVRKAVTMIKGRALVEVSGGVTLETVQELAAAGADYISIGALTHSAPAVDMSMDMLPLAHVKQKEPNKRLLMLPLAASRPLSAKTIQATLTTKSLGWNLHILEEASSTNTVALQLAAEGAQHGTVVIAEQQTGGRGRLGRHWYSPAHQNLYCSIIVQMKLSPTQVLWLPLVTGMAIAQTVEQEAGLQPSLKWPNDILIGRRKIGGILCESTSHGKQDGAMIIGIGLNVNAGKDTFPLDLQESATSLVIETEHLFDRHSLVATLLSHLETHLEMLLSGDPRQLKQAYLARCSTIGRTVMVHMNNGEQLEGFAQDIASDGALRVLPTADPSNPHTTDSSAIEIRSGDVTYVRSFVRSFT